MAGRIPPIHAFGDEWVSCSKFMKSLLQDPNNLLYLGIIFMIAGLSLILIIYFLNSKFKTLMEQLQFQFEPLLTPSRTFNRQSDEAYHSIKDEKEDTFTKILEAHRRCPLGLTSEELSFEAKISYESAHKRHADLVKMKKLYNSGIKRTNKSGRKAEVRKIL